MRSSFWLPALGALLLALGGGCPGGPPNPPATALAFSVQPSSVQGGTVIAPAVKVEARDSSGNVVPTFTGNVTVALGNNPGSGTLSGTTTVAAVGGVATFSDLRVDNAGSGYTLVASSSGLSSGTSVGFDITGNTADLVFSVQPSSVAVNTVISPAVKVQARDSSGNVVPSFTGNVTVALGNNPGSGTLSGTTTVAAVGGVATFLDLKVNNAGSGYTLVASSSGLRSATSAAFAVTGSTNALVFSVQPSSVPMNVVISPAVKVEARDPSGNVLTSFIGNVTVALGNNPGSGTLSGTTTVAAVGGVATFSDLKVNNAGSGYTLVASNSGFSDVTSAAFNVVGNPAAVSFSVQPATVQAGVVMSPVKVEVQDSHGSVVVGFGGFVSLALGNNPGSGTLSGTTTVAAVGGVATFSDLQVDNAGSGYTLVASSQSLASATSVAFDVTAHAGGHAISGTVSGAVAQGVSIHLTGPSTDITTTTAAAGTYSFSGLADGNYTVTPSLGGFAFSPASRSPALAGADVGGQDFTASPVAPGAHTYVADTTNNRIVQMDDLVPNGWATYGTTGSGVGQFSGPSGLFVDQGQIYVSDNGNARIVRMDNIFGGGWTTFGSSGTGTNQFAGPMGLFVDSAHGHIYVVDGGNHRIVRMNDMTGGGWVSYGSRGSGVGQFNFPWGIWVDPAEHIYVTDYLNNRVVRMNDMTGAGWVTLGTTGPGTKQFESPRGIAGDAQGRIYVCDDLNNRVIRMDDMLGTGWTSLGGPAPGPGAGQFDGPSGLSIDTSGRIYATSYRSNRISQMDDMTGAGWVGLGAQGTGTGQFHFPLGIFHR